MTHPVVFTTRKQQISTYVFPYPSQCLSCVNRDYIHPGVLEFSNQNFIIMCHPWS
jgi:hypothetical protein